MRIDSKAESFHNVRLAQQRRSRQQFKPGHNVATTENLRRFCLCLFPSQKGQQKSARQKKIIKMRCLSAATSRPTKSFLGEADKQLVPHQSPRRQSTQLGTRAPSTTAPHTKTLFFCAVIGRRRACGGLERCGPGGDKGHSGCGRGKLYPVAARATARRIVLPRVIGPARSAKWRSPLAPKRARRGRAELSGGLDQVVTCTVPLSLC